MSISIPGLGDVGRHDVNVAGGKGANLGEMVRQGFPVPPGIVVPAEACRVFFEHIGLGDHIRGLDELSDVDREARCRQVRARIEATALPDDLSEAIMAAHADLAGTRDDAFVCAVRSSGTAEDLGEASFAGQHETYYYVDRDRILEMVRHCWSSLFSPEAVSYRTTQGIDHAGVFMAVVVQEMIPSEVSGVTFTANPVTGSREEVVTESSWGMGAAIVDGRVTPDRYILEREGLRLKEKRISEKKFMVPARFEKGMTSRLQDVPSSMRHRETLSPDQARTVTKWALEAETHFGGPQDVEWAMAGGRFYMLQSRPITIMGREDIARGIEGQFVIFKPMVENFTAPLTPLTGDMISLFFAPPLMRRIRGWLYINLKHLRAFLPFKNTNEELAGLIYGFDTDAPPMRISWAKLPLTLAVLFVSYLFFGVFFARTRRMPAGFMERFRELARRVDEDPGLGPFETEGRLFGWASLLDPIGHLVMMVNLASMRYVFRLDLMKKLLRGWLPDLRDDAESLLCSGAEGVKSAEMGRGIWELAKVAKRQARVREILGKHKPEQALAALRTDPEAAEFLAHLDRFLAVNGHRALKELELASIRWEEDPSPVLGMVRNYLLLESDPSEHERKVDQVRRELDGEIRRLLEKYPLEKPFRPRYRLLRYTAERTRYFSRQRENSRFFHIMGFYSLRKKILTIEAELMKQGRLRCRGDVFFLKLGEMDRLRSGELGWLDVEDRIRERRMEYIRLSKMTPPKAIGLCIPDRRPETDEADRDDATLKGQAASPGEYQGVAHVILDPSIDIELKPGEILVAPYTDPAWTPLFLTAGAAVVEVGSYLSHAGTVAREFGMPCVVDLPDCTRLIHTGARIHVNGDRGLVRVLKEGPEETT
ncbi:MAG: hypothetical protein KKB20_01670 [Proteobacteria bacterium]|nr:hypothetical protein [Pseudomonadota bacterium]